MGWDHAPHGGGTAYGSHFWKTWDSCQRKWYLKFRAPHPDGEGLSPIFTSSPLMIGIGVHEGLAAYYASAPESGEYKIDPAIAAVEASMLPRRDEWEDRQTYDDDLAEATSLLLAYDEWWGPNGTSCDYPEMKIMVDKDGPIIERHYEVILPNGGGFTCRVDAMVTYNNWAYVLEHKTTSVYGVTPLRNNSYLDSQMTGECMILQDHFPDVPIHGILLNILVKGRGPKTKFPPFLRDTIPRTASQVEQFKIDLASKFRTLSEANDWYDHLLTEEGGGLQPWHAARLVYQLNGTSNGSCRAYNRDCEFANFCKGTGLGIEEALVGAYRASKRVEPPTPDGETPENF